MPCLSAKLSYMNFIFTEIAPLPELSLRIYFLKIEIYLVRKRLKQHAHRKCSSACQELDLKIKCLGESEETQF